MIPAEAPSPTLPTEPGAPEDPATVLRLYDTMSRTVRPLVPMDGTTLRFYCCGPTVYGPAHIGNFRSFVVQDVFRRTVEALGTATRHVRNLTDVDDKTIRQSMSEGRSLTDFTREWTEKFHADCAQLAVLPPHEEPGAVAHIPDQIALICQLEEKGHAYRAEDGSVYFRISSFPAYGALSRLSERTITTPGAPASGAAPAADTAAASSAWNDEYDREAAADFALWKAQRPEDGPNFWDSPWGPGRPGWHIECSAMSMRYLGPSFDLHGGGVDLIFPHHENEIAQSEAATGQTFVRHWFHVAHLLVEGKKMSKSLGNLYTLADVCARGFTAEDLRFVLLSGQYRQPLNFTWDSLRAAHAALTRLREFRGRLGVAQPGQPPRQPGGPADFGPFLPVLTAMLDDLNTPEAFGRLFVLLKEWNAVDPAEVPPAVAAGFESVLCLLGFALPPAPVSEVPESIADLARLRWEAKKSKNWAEADRLRQEIQQAGWSVKDSPQGYDLAPLPQP